MWSDALIPLRSLVAVLDTGSIAAAARATGYSPAAVSRHLSGLEREFGVTLFERSARSMRPSVLSRVIGDKARLLLDEADQFEEEVRAVAGGRAGVVRLAYFRAVGPTLLPMIFARFASARPGARLDVRECALSEEVEALLRRGEADVGFTWGFPEPEASDLISRPLLRDALVLLTAVDRDDLHEDPTDLSRLVGEPFASASEHRGSPPIVDQMFLAQGLRTPTITQRLSDHAMSKALIAAGVVVALIPALGISDAAPGIRRSTVVPDFRHVYLTRAPGPLNPVVPALERVVCEVVRDYRGFGVESLV